LNFEFSAMKPGNFRPFDIVCTVTIIAMKWLNWY